MGRGRHKVWLESGWGRGQGGAGHQKCEGGGVGVGGAG